MDSIGGFGLPSDSFSESNFGCSGGIESSDGYEFIGERAFSKLVPPNFHCSNFNKKYEDFRGLYKHIQTREHLKNV